MITRSLLHHVTITDRGFCRFWASGLLLLIGVTWPLWFSRLHDSYPSVPLLPIPAAMLPMALLIGCGCSLALVCSLAWIAIGKGSRNSWLACASMLLIGFLIDQHRIQPWAYQSFFYGIMFAFIPVESWKRWMRPLIVSIYAFSALGKLDAQFLNTVGRDFVEMLTDYLPGTLSEQAQRNRVILSASLPIAELLIAGSLCFVRLRFFGSISAIAMHLSLIAILGPWAKNHSLGVLIWNALLIGQHVYLIGANENANLKTLTSPVLQGRFGIDKLKMRLVGLLWIIAITAPTLERQGYWDHWTSWSLYSPHTSRARIELHQSVFHELNDLQQASLIADHDLDQWQEISLGDWSLSSRGVPVYPQSRYQLELAAIIASQLNTADGIRVKLQSVSDRRTGGRREELLLNLQEINQARRNFWLHPQPNS